MATQNRRLPGASMNKETWQAISTEGKVTWDFLDDLAAGRLELPGPHLAALWQLRTFARKSTDPRVVTLGL